MATKISVNGSLIINHYDKVKYYKDSKIELREVIDGVKNMMVVYPNDDYYGTATRYFKDCLDDNDEYLVVFLEDEPEAPLFFRNSYVDAFKY